MKKGILLFLVIPILSFTLRNNNDTIIGNWIGEDGGEIAYISFDKEGYAFFEMEGQIVGGKEFILKGKKGSIEYLVDDSKNPMEIDIIMTKLENGDQKKLLCIAKFKGPDEMIFAANFDSTRPSEFNADNTMLFKREK